MSQAGETKRQNFNVSPAQEALIEWLRQWIQIDRWNALTPREREKFPPIAPDFVLELMSPSDSLSETQAKMREYMSAKVRLGCLIDRKNHRVEIYRLGQEVEILDSPATLSGEDVLPGFALDMRFVW
ncbi:hypothetical protein RIVM261_074050 [Rivularia sp. IAM M-261]|nr:hypothetical protein CAL7716_047180 [Calothrix sp. PCC 7716]GJD22449.1 hypothetical protein RIVM261_074050 [Rivularia sp. IAM M-261]